MGIGEGEQQMEIKTACRIYRARVCFGLREAKMVADSLEDYLNQEALTNRIPLIKAVREIVNYHALPAIEVVKRRRKKK